MPLLLEKIQVCKETRKRAATMILDAFKNAQNPSELDIKNSVAKQLTDDAALFDSGWYAPPPEGSAFLFAPADKSERLLFDTLRNETFFSDHTHRFNDDSVGIIYLSPTHRETGIIGDIGLTIFNGTDHETQRHFSNTYAAMHDVLNMIKVGMQFKEIHDLAQDIFTKRNLSNGRTVTWHDTTGTNLGHTVPWSYEDMSDEEQLLLRTGDMEKFKNAVSYKRLYINAVEEFAVPSDIVFTFEARLESRNNPALPNIFWHFMVAFTDGNKEILSNMDDIFIQFGMDKYINSQL